MKHVLTVDDVGPHLNRLFDLGECMKLALDPGLDTYYRESLKDKLVGLFFAEPSTRTKSSFQAAIKRMGGDYVDILTEWSSTKKGETFEDTLLTMSAYFDALVIRLGRPIDPGFTCSKPVINAGDGSGEHPTQALLDVFTINQRFAKPYNICIAGDLTRSRVVRSLYKMISKYNRVKPNKIYYYGTELPEDLYGTGEKFYRHCDLYDVAGELDILYMTRMQQERGSEVSPPLIVGTELKLSRLKDTAVIMHPLPRQAEIPTFVDKDPRAIYFTEQLPNGLYMRMALLHWLIGRDGPPDML